MPYFLYALLVYGYLITPTLLIWGWIRWWKQPSNNLSAWFAFSSLLLTTGSAMLALVTFVHANHIGGFPYYDPRLLRLYRWGLLSLVAFMLSLGGVWRSHCLRWLAPAASLGAFVFWFCAASSE